MSERALITGITGQDAYYLATLLLERGYEVHGTTRSLSASHVERLGDLLSRVKIHACDLCSSPAVTGLIESIRPREVYNLAGPSFVPDCVADPLMAAKLIGLTPLLFLEAIRSVKPDTRLFQAGTSELFADARDAPQSESTPFCPLNPYGAAKAFAYWTVRDYRRRHGLFACNGILFNHESPRRDERFVTRKITLAAARIALGKQKELVLGNLDARRDWGYAGDFVHAMYAMLNHEKPDDYVIATGTQHSVRDFAEAAFSSVGLNWRQHVVSDEGLRRSGDAHLLTGDASRARDVLGWQPRTTFTELVCQMVRADLIQEGADPSWTERVDKFSREQKGI